MSIFCYAKNSSLLTQVETHYREAETVKMDVAKTLRLSLLDQEKKSEGTIKIKKGGLLRWESMAPTHTLVLADGKYIWLVDYAEGEDEKPNIIKATNPKKTQPHQVVAFLLGQGKISNDFIVTGEKSVGSHDMKLELRPKSEADEVKWLTLVIDKDKKEIEKLSFQDSVGNITELEFKDVQFDTEMNKSVFMYSPPKGAEITNLR